MKEYILNKSPINTTNSFNINDIKLKLDINDKYNLKNINISNDKDLIVKINEVNNNLSSKIGLKFNKYIDVNIIVPQDTIIEKEVLINYDFNNNDYLIHNINIIYEENSVCDFIFKYKSNDELKHINYLKEIITASKNSKGNISIINLLNDNSYSFISIEGNISENASIKHNIIDLGGNIRLTNVDINLNEYMSTNYLNTLYIGKDNDIIDINYYVKNKGIESINEICVEGALNNKALKNFRGTISFMEGAKNAIGKENENVVFLSDDCISRSMPMLLCHEENVEGAHGVSSGKIDNEKLFYLMSRGISKKESEKLIINGNFNKIINEINNDDLKEEIIKIMNKKIA